MISDEFVIIEEALSTAAWELEVCLAGKPAMLIHRLCDSEAVLDFDWFLLVTRLPSSWWRFRKRLGGIVLTREDAFWAQLFAMITTYCIIRVRSVSLGTQRLYGVSWCQHSLPTLCMYRLICPRGTNRHVLPVVTLDALDQDHSPSLPSVPSLSS